MDIRSLTQAEAEQRAALLTVERYDVAVDLTDLAAGSRVRCVSTVTFACREPGAETFVDCAAQAMGATLNGVALPPAEGGRIALRGLAARNVLRVETVQANTADGAGVHRAVDPADGSVYVWMTFEPDEARFVWACFDQPDLKAPHAFTVTAPAGWTVTSNSGDPRVDDVEGDWVEAGAGDGSGARRWVFPDTPPLATYNTVVNAGPFHTVRRETGGYDLGLHVRQSLAAVLDRDAEEIFTLTRQGLEFYASVFGMPFPQHKYDQVFMPEFGGAMENYGCVTWSDDFLRRAVPTPVERQTLAEVLLHEMAHMWFGNIVTMRWWDDLWLNEAFAEFACYWAASRATAYTDVWAGHLAAGKLRAYLADQGPTSHPIRQPMRDVAEAASIFDAITYEKGASVLQQLMTYVGEDNFSAGMTAYFARHAWGNTTLQDLIDALAKTSGRDLDAWRAGWLDTAGTDRLSLERGSGDEDSGGGFVLVAEGPAGRPRPQVLAVGAYLRAGDRLERTALAKIDVEDARTPVRLPAGAELYLVNDEDLTFATVRSGTAADVAGLASAAALLPTAISRGVAVATVWNTLINGEAPASEAVHCVASVLAAETCDSVIEPYLTLATDAAQLWAPDAKRPELTAVVAGACRTLAQSEEHRRVALRALARCAADLGEVARLQTDAGDDVDLQWRALVRKAELGGDCAEECERLLRLDPDPDARVRALAVQAAAPDAAAKAAVWEKAAVRRAVPISSVGQIMDAFWRPGQDALLAPYAQRYLELLPELDRGGMIPAMVLARWLLPLYGIDQAYLDSALAAGRQAAPVVGKTLAERVDLVSRMLRSRSRGSR